MTVLKELSKSMIEIKNPFGKIIWKGDSLESFIAHRYDLMQISEKILKRRTERQWKVLRKLGYVCNKISRT